METKNPATKEDLINILVKQQPTGGFDIKTGENLQEKAKNEYEEWTEEELRKKINEQILNAEKEALKRKVFHLYLADKTSKEKASELITQFLKKKYTFKSIKNDDKKEMWVYREGIYEPNGESTIQEEIREILEESYTTQKTNQVIEKIRADTFINQEEFFNQQNKHPNLIPVKNGVLNVKTKELQTFTDKNYFFNKINAKYDLEADCPKIKQFIKEITKNEEDYKTIQELIGYSLVKNYKFEKIFILIGSGRNGKGKLLELIKRLLGVENVSEVSIDNLTNDKWSLSTLHNKLLNMSGDIGNNTLKSTAILKSLSGGDLQQADRKFQTPIKFTNYAKLVFALNELPRTMDTTDAFFMRLIILEFPYTFLSKQDYEALNEEERKSCKLQDKNLIEKLSNEKELNGLLNWALEGFQRLNEKQEFTYSKTTKEVKNYYLRQSDSFLTFCMEHLEEDYDSKISKQHLKSVYLQYCRHNGVKPQSDRVINNILTKEYGAYDVQILLSSGERPRVWSGIKFAQGSQGEQALSTLNENLIFAYRSKLGENPVKGV